MGFTISQVNVVVLIPIQLSLMPLLRLLYVLFEMKILHSTYANSSSLHMDNLAQDTRIRIHKKVYDVLLTCV